MAASVTHTKVSIVADSADTDDVRMSDWNANHTISISAADVGAEASGAVATHAAAGDPHPVYETSTEAAAKVTTHAGAADPHGDRSFTTSAVSTHAGLSDPHTGYLQESAAAAVATSGSASDLATGTLPIARIADGAVTLAKMANVATATILGRTTAATGVPEALTLAQAKTLLGLPLGSQNLTLYGTAGTWTDQPSATTEFLGVTSHRHQYDFTGVTEARFKVRVTTAGFSGAYLRPQYSTDDTTFAILASSSTALDISLTTTGTKRSAWAAIAAGAKIDPCYIRIVGADGNATVDPVIAMVELEVR